MKMVDDVKREKNMKTTKEQTRDRANGGISSVRELSVDIKLFQDHDLYKVNIF